MFNQPRDFIMTGPLIDGNRGNDEEYAPRTSSLPPPQSRDDTGASRSGDGRGMFNQPRDFIMTGPLIDGNGDEYALRTSGLPMLKFFLLVNVTTNISTISSQCKQRAYFINNSTDRHLC
jgi:hypothetical protein